MRWVLLIMLAACGRVGFDARGDATGDDGADRDGTALTYRAAVLADLPLGYWRLGDAGTVARDETGRLDGQYRGGCQHGVAGALAGDADPATAFDGSSCYVQLADALGFLARDAFTIELWTSTVDTGTYQHYFTRESRTPGNLPQDGYALLMLPGGGVKVERAVNQAFTGSPGFVIARACFTTWSGSTTARAPACSSTASPAPPSPTRPASYPSRLSR